MQLYIHVFIKKETTNTYNKFKIAFCVGIDYFLSQTQMKGTRKEISYLDVS